MNAATNEEFDAHLNRYQNVVLPAETEGGVDYTFMGLVEQLWNLIDGARVRRAIMTEIVWEVGVNNMANAVDPDAHIANLAWVRRQNFNNHSLDYIRRFKAMINAANEQQKLLMYAILQGIRIPNEDIYFAENIQLINQNHIINNRPNPNNSNDVMNNGI